MNGNLTKDNMERMIKPKFRCTKTFDNLLNKPSRKGIEGRLVKLFAPDLYISQRNAKGTKTF